ncbi:MarR family protein [Clostridium puniceum]|uniref:MarR family protein n=1 Tax=Clostridium puniceum TaxID=29367 RepID=A0A1S8TUR0_9CLOT|nr:MarR family transcriptional regulator [Clostridium puniceum]OOM81496.1 MarR family protein [Clostridium puniceum]
MNSRKDLPSVNDELTQKQADEIIDIFKNIRKAISFKSEKSAKKYGFTAPQLGVIFHLYMMPSITLNNLSEHMVLTKSTVSGIVDRLEKQGVVKREIPKNNRRIVKLSLSEEFKKNNDVCKMKKEFITGFIAEAIKNTDSDEIKNMIDGLRQLSILLNENE